MKQRLIVAGAILLILVVIAGYWLGTADFTDDLNLEEKQEKEKADEDTTEQ